MLPDEVPPDGATGMGPVPDETPPDGVTRAVEPPALTPAEGDGVGRSAPQRRKEERRTRTVARRQRGGRRRGACRRTSLGAGEDKGRSLVVGEKGGGEELGLDRSVGMQNEEKGAGRLVLVVNLTFDDAYKRRLRL
ncbi:uncharacterized protein LOC120110230 [Phoenix dactylifera]|uniref:Uncharacterized protein LOC120110230 n=1 Tax=Phoenix dactylifera TaxID=42345 RepID=A0A8B9A4C8_PHODC|nr:uncharacterized protein LOC120110230 [Phoenix dactylifera]